MIRRRSTLLVVLMVMALLVSGCGLLKQTGTISGTVTLNGEAPGKVSVEVVVVGSRHTAKVSADGTFKLELPSPAKYILEVKGEGIIPVRTAVSLGKGANVTGVTLDTAYLPPLPVTLNLDDPMHTVLIKKAYDHLEYDIKPDPNGKTGLFFPPGSASQNPPEGAYPHMRFVTLEYPGIDDFEIRVKSIGEGGLDPNSEHLNGGNRSVAIIFGYQDVANYWVAYLTSYSSTRLTRVVNGQGSSICSSGTTGIWKANNDVYQEASATLTTEGDKKVLRVYINGELWPLGECWFDASWYTPGKLGLGGHPSDANGSWYYSDIYINAL